MIWRNFQNFGLYTKKSRNYILRFWLFGALGFACKANRNKLLID